MAQASESTNAAAQNSNHLVTEIRDTFGKGVARKIRATGKIPAVIYGHGTEPQHVTLPGHETALILRKSNQVLELDIQGKVQLALVKDVQKDPVRQIIEHIDLIVVRRGEKVTVDVPVHIEGESAPGTAVNQNSNTLSVEVEAIHIPESFVVSIEGLEEGAHILAKDVELPAGATLITDPDTLVVGITGEVAQDLGEEDEAAAEVAEGDDAASEDAE
jgi:large subunit ribosomal protein L25